jgi:hypothetical protein
MYLHIHTTAAAICNTVHYCSIAYCMLKQQLQISYSPVYLIVTHNYILILARQFSLGEISDLTFIPNLNSTSLSYHVRLDILPPQGNIFLSKEGSSCPCPVGIPLAISATSRVSCFFSEPTPVSPWSYCFYVVSITVKIL